MRAYEKDRSPLVRFFPFRMCARAHVRSQCFAKERIADQSVAQVAQRRKRRGGRCLSDGEALAPGELSHAAQPSDGEGLWRGDSATAAQPSYGEGLRADEPGHGPGPN